MDKVSIVVPIYKVEQYLNQCIDSLIKQTYENIEIILVDDGSPDGCPKICDEYKKIDQRIKVIHKKNGGLSDARNVGLESATGIFICFVDSDDYVEKTFIEELINAIKKNKTKISQCGIKYVNNNGKVLFNKGYNEDSVFSGIKMIEDQYYGHDIENVVAWNRLYDIKLFKNIRFPKGKIHEDEYTTYKLFYDQKNVAVIKSNLYNYRQSDNSIMRSSFNIKRMDILDGLEEKMLFFKQRKEDKLYYLTVSKFLACVRFIYINVFKYYPDKKELLKELKNSYNKYYKISKKYKSISISTKIKNYLFYIAPHFYIILKKV